MSLTSSRGANYAVKKTIYIGKQCGMQLDEIGGIKMEERNLVAVSIKHTIYGWKFGMPCWLWGCRTKDEEERSFAGYTQFPNNAEAYSLEERQKSGYGAGDVCKVDEPVQMCIDFCKKYKMYDTVLVPLEQYIKYCECANLPLDKPKGG
jgi:hypothetical protein